MNIPNLRLLPLVASLMAGGVQGCSDEQDAVHAAQSSGMTDVRVIDSDYFFNFTCSEGEMAYQIQARNPQGGNINATVCCGYTTPWKGCTIRYEN